MCVHGNGVNPSVDCGLLENVKNFGSDLINDLSFSPRIEGKFFDGAPAAREIFVMGGSGSCRRPKIFF